MKDRATDSSNWGGLHWSPWFPLEASLDVYRDLSPKKAGFYRVRAGNQSCLVYVGQTGCSLFERVRSLRSGVYRDEDDPPWNDPHTAAPLLWAYRHEDSLRYEVSVTACDLDYPSRQCQEDALLYLHRIRHGHSTLCNHGRLHPYWTRASNRSKSRPTDRRKTKGEFPSLPPACGNDDFLANDWLGLEWQEPESMADHDLHQQGVYRIIHGDELAYVGETRDLKNRLSEHHKGGRFRGCLYSVNVMPFVLPHQLKERETDLIGAYYLRKNSPPVWQYRGQKGR